MLLAHTFPICGQRDVNVIRSTDRAIFGDLCPLGSPHCGMQVNISSHFIGLFPSTAVHFVHEHAASAALNIETLRLQGKTCMH